MARWICLSRRLRGEFNRQAARARGTRPAILADRGALGRIGILEFREEVAVASDEESPEPQDVVLLGKIGGGGTATWSPTSAEFMLIDPTFELEAGDHICTDGNCPFCKSKDEKDKAQAIVSLVGADGRVPAAPVRKLLPLEEGQIVVVRGQAEVNSLGVLVVRASGLAVRR